MFILGLQGSPRVKKSNTRFLLSAFMQQAESLGARTHVVEVPGKNIIPCKEYIVCEKKGFCPIDDDMKHEIFALIRKADVIVCATPIFFFNMTAQLKALVDRCQTFWGRKYRLKLRDPGSRTRQGFLLAVVAIGGFVPQSLAPASTFPLPARLSLSPLSDSGRENRIRYSRPTIGRRAGQAESTQPGGVIGNTRDFGSLIPGSSPGRVGVFGVRAAWGCYPASSRWVPKKVIGPPFPKHPSGPAGKRCSLPSPKPPFGGILVG